jgi:hypothetical protein
MNLAVPRVEQLWRHLQRLPHREIRLTDVYALGPVLGMTPATLRKGMVALEKADKLVRIYRGVYITMETYTAHPGLYRAEGTAWGS